MNETYDFSACSFIEEHMQYYTYYDFCDNRKAIRRLYDALDINGKTFYHYYVYANTHMDLYFKNAIWDYLNGYDDMCYQLLELKKKYRAK